MLWQKPNLAPNNSVSNAIDGDNIFFLPLVPISQPLLNKLNLRMHTYLRTTSRVLVTAPPSVVLGDVDYINKIPSETLDNCTVAETCRGCST
jgi:hypothetical protein